MQQQRLLQSGRSADQLRAAGWLPNVETIIDTNYL